MMLNILSRSCHFKQEHQLSQIYRAFTDGVWWVFGNKIWNVFYTVA